MLRQFSISAILILAPSTLALDPVVEAPKSGYDPGLAPASPEGQDAIARFTMEAGLRVSLVAAEPMLANPVCLYIDYNNKLYVAETYRHHHGVTDMRGHTEWLIDDLAARTVEDRLVAMKDNLGDGFASYSKEQDRVRYLEDRDNDGVFDRSTVFADGFNDALAGIGAGLLSDRGDIYYTCIPELWRLKDVDGDGVADERKVMSSGYGVHINFLGHDLHGLRKGPDGRIYFSIGDRGVHIKTLEGTIIDDPDTGLVLRCEPDGSGLEVVHRGLRNPQELVFDDYGNLFTGDNNSDGGDQARWVWLVEQGDSGWRIGYQWMKTPVLRGPWNDEKMWEPYHEGQPAHILPPIANIGAGPSGLTYYPGTGLSDAYRGHFFLCDFRGDADRSLIHTFSLEPDGASFKVAKQRPFIEHVLATDADFGVAGGLYVSDWTQGWDQPKKGRIYRVQSLGENAEETAAARALLEAGMTQRSVAELAELLSHADQRVRLESQWALAERGEEGLHALLNTASNCEVLLARLHGIWGAGQFLRRGQCAPDPLLALLGDAEAEVRTQAARVLAESHCAAAVPGFGALLSDASARVRFFGAQGLGLVPRSGDPAIQQAIIALLAENDNLDAYLRYAGVMALKAQFSVDELAGLRVHPAPAVRLAAVLALRRLADPAVAGFLGDPVPGIIVEAARAINDAPIPGAYGDLAALSMRRDLEALGGGALVRRVLNAHYHVAGRQNVDAVAQLAEGPSQTESTRVMALNMLGQWGKPSPLDPVTGAYQPFETGSVDDARGAAERIVRAALEEASGDVLVAMIEVVGTLGLEDFAPKLTALLDERGIMIKTKLAALDALAKLNAPDWEATLLRTLEARQGKVRASALTYLAKIAPEKAVARLESTLVQGELEEKRASLELMGYFEDPAIGALLAQWVGKLADGSAPPELALDVYRAAERSEFPAVVDAFKALTLAYEAAPGTKYQLALVGGNAESGKNVFLTKIETSCLRCHAYTDAGSSVVGPDLSHVGSRLKREELLESIVKPNAKIAVGFETVMIRTSDGKRKIGRVLEESGAEVKLVLTQNDEDEYDPFADESENPHSTVDVVAEHGDGGPHPEFKTITIPKDTIAHRQGTLSSMPEDLVKYLTLSELRDLVAFLAGSVEAVPVAPVAAAPAGDGA
ncbi:MAG: HEAT repeat domain-containing protein [Candidatus Hydrogenedentes bacterium]|nr:HEAT repeat domain-containing protein [Candidatus Hydrogenedentota bacterium]